MKAPFESSSIADEDADERVRRVELIISNLLRAGVLGSLALVVLGTVLTLAHHPEYLASPADLSRLVQPGAAFPHSTRDVFEGVRLLSGQAIVTAGLLLLIVTPVMRVAVSIFAFIYQGDRTFTLITALVLLLLLLSFFLGAVE
ncbi:MAG: DUF1634 domain-containing protein [Alphaproteobacteria bacterium]